MTPVLVATVAALLVDVVLADWQSRRAHASLLVSLPMVVAGHGRRAH